MFTNLFTVSCKAREFYVGTEVAAMTLGRGLSKIFSVLLVACIAICLSNVNGEEKFVHVILDSDGKTLHVQPGRFPQRARQAVVAGGMFRDAINSTG